MSDWIRTGGAAIGVLSMAVLTALSEAPGVVSAAALSTQDRGALQVRSLLGRPLYAMPDESAPENLSAKLTAAREALAADPKDPAKLGWHGRRLAYLWRYAEAIDVYSAAIKIHPDCAPLYRHRGHRLISLRRFDAAIADLTRAAELIAGKPDRVEPDGAPNKLDKPLTTTAFNVCYHLALAHYLKGDFQTSLAAWRKTMEYARRYDDNLVAVTDWMYMTLRKLGRDTEAAALLQTITPKMEIIENQAYHRRLLMYKGLVSPDTLLDLEHATDLDLATLGYGVGNWHLLNGLENKAREIFERVTNGPYWPAFGFIAAEADLARLK